MQMAKESGQQGWWHAYSDIPQSVYIALKTDAASLHAYESMAIPGLLQTHAYAHAVIGETIPLLTVEEAGTRLKVRLRRQHRIYDPACPLRLWVVLDESALRRAVGSPDVMREQLKHLNALGAEPHGPPLHCGRSSGPVRTVLHPEVRRQLRGGGGVFGAVHP